ncbi:MAG: bacterial Ig-like domain-containing protein [Treponema sp.]|nr:bacterial Ig-like domain-containing protein [Treponema sp.]
MKGGEVSGNSAADSGGGVYVNNVGANNVFHITHGTVYGTNETNAALRNTATTGAALWKNGGTAVYGNGAGTPIPLTAGTNARDVTIEVNNGVLTLPSLSSISVTGPTKTTYTVGQHLDTTGMVVTAHYSDGTTETVTGYTLSDFNSATTGTKTITVSYQGKTATFSVTVSAYAPQPPDDATVIYVAASPGQGGEPTSVLWTTAVSTVNNASSGTNFAIIVVQDIGISGASFMTNTFTKANLNLYLAGKTGTETVTLTSNGTLLTIGSYSGPIQNVTMDGLTLKGQGIADGDPVNDNSPLVRIWTDCTFTMKGGEISGNTSSGVSIDGGIFNMSGSAKVSGNIVNGRGGGVYVQNGTFNMLGGEVSGNKASQGGGGVTFDRSTFNMSGGKISGNTASGDGGGGVDGGIGTFNMSGGEISGNTASGAYGTGGGARITGSNFYISNGTIYGNNESSAALRNTATNSGAALYIAISRTAEYGTFNGETWNKIDDIPLNTSTDRDATLRVENGVLQ